MTLVRIIELLPVPTEASEQGSGSWGTLPEEFGRRLPEAYVDFVSTYGTGSIGAFLWVLNPFSNNPSLNLDQARYFRDAYQSLRDSFPQYYARKIDDFLPWAFTDNGDAIVWVVDDGDPNEWRVCIQSSDPAQEEMTDLNTQAFLEALLEKKLVSSILPSDFLEAEKMFAPV